MPEDEGIVNDRYPCFRRVVLWRIIKYQGGQFCPTLFPQEPSAMRHVPDVRRRGVGLYAAVVVLWCMLAPLLAFAEQFTGKVVGIGDGDTISVLREGKAVKVRL